MGYICGNWIHSSIISKSRVVTEHDTHDRDGYIGSFSGIILQWQYNPWIILRNSKPWRLIYTYWIQCGSADTVTISTPSLLVDIVWYTTRLFYTGFDHNASLQSWPLPSVWFDSGCLCWILEGIKKNTLHPNWWQKNKNLTKCWNQNSDKFAWRNMIFRHANLSLVWFQISECSPCVFVTVIVTTFGNIFEFCIATNLGIKIYFCYQRCENQLTFKVS